MRRLAAVWRLTKGSRVHWLCRSSLIRQTNTVIQRRAPVWVPYHVHGPLCLCSDQGSLRAPAERCGPYVHPPDPPPDVRPKLTMPCAQRLAPVANHLDTLHKTLQAPLWHEPSARHVERTCALLQLAALLPSFQQGPKGQRLPQRTCSRSRKPVASGTGAQLGGWLDARGCSGSCCGISSTHTRWVGGRGAADGHTLLLAMHEAAAPGPAHAASGLIQLLHGAGSYWGAAAGPALAAGQRGMLAQGPAM